MKIEKARHTQQQFLFTAKLPQLDSSTFSHQSDRHCCLSIPRAMFQFRMLFDLRGVSLLLRILPEQNEEKQTTNKQDSWRVGEI